jgi:hypothetical protein
VQGKLQSRSAGRPSLAQHGAACGVLGKVENQPESRRDGTGSHVDYSAAETFQNLLVGDARSLSNAQSAAIADLSPA